ncbi:Uncharacterized protein PPKH_1274 [Pseudomonas putida]|nr:Uncharacterized protein PPKH_1274 [Pseudomonas putida]
MLLWFFWKSTAAPFFSYMGQLFLVMSAEMYSTLTVVGDMGINNLSVSLWLCRL